MTIILSAMPDNCPVLFGDLLISGNEDPEIIISIPAVGKTTNVFPEGSKYTITNLKQKVTIINSHFAIAWAGSPMASCVVINELKELCNLPDFSAESISNYFKNIGEDIEKHGVSFIALFIDKIDESSIQANIISHNTKSYPNSPFGLLCIEGTGHDKAIKLLQQLDGANSNYEKDPTPEDKALGIVNFLGASLLNDEITTHETLLNYYGGGYEAVLYLDGKLTKLNNTAFIFWQAHIEDKDNLSISLPNKVFHHHYHKDILGIRYFMIEHGDSTEYVDLKLREHTLHMIPSIINMCAQEDAQAILSANIVTERVVNYVDVFDKTNNYIVTLYSFDFLKDKKAGVRFNMSGDGSITMTIENEFLMYLKGMISEIDCDSFK